MARQASFNRHEAPDGTVFDIIPAQTSYVTYMVLALLYAFALALMRLGAWPIIWLPILLLTAFSHYRTWSRYQRAPVTIKVGSNGIQVGGAVYSGTDIRSLHICQPWTNGGNETEYVNGPVTLGHQARWRAEERSYALMLRLKSSSRLIPLSRGLTYRTGVMLREDVIEALGK